MFCLWLLNLIIETALCIVSCHLIYQNSSLVIVFINMLTLSCFWGITLIDYMIKYFLLICCNSMKGMIEVASSWRYDCLRFLQELIK